MTIGGQSGIEITQNRQMKLDLINYIMACYCCWLGGVHWSFLGLLLGYFVVGKGSSTLSLSVFPLLDFC